MLNMTNLSPFRCWHVKQLPCHFHKKWIKVTHVEITVEVYLYLIVLDAILPGTTVAQGNINITNLLIN